MEMIKLTDISRPKQWKTISAKMLKENGFPVYGANGKIGFYDKYTHENPTVLITCRGATCGTINISEPKSYVNGNAMALDSLSESYSLKYLYYVLIARGLNDVISGSAQPQITRTNLANVLLPNPPLKTQQKIAAILDEADKLRQLDKKLIKKHEALSQSLFLEMFGDPVSNSKKLDELPLLSLTTKIGSGATPKGGKEAYFSEGISLIRSLNIHNNKFKYKNLAFIDNGQAQKLRSVIVKENDVLFNITGASVCRTAIVPKDVLPARVNQHVAILRPEKNKLNSIFLCHLLISSNFQGKLEDLASKGGATRQAINKSQLENLLIPLPSLDKQLEFAEAILELEKQKTQAQRVLQQSEELFNSLLQKAFKGELA